MEENPKPPRLRLTVIEVGTCICGKAGTDFLIADEGADVAKILKGEEAIYCEVEDRLTAHIFVRSVNTFPDLMQALSAITDHLARIAAADDNAAALVIAQANTAMAAATGPIPLPKPEATAVAHD